MELPELENTSKRVTLTSQRNPLPSICKPKYCPNHTELKAAFDGVSASHRTPCKTVQVNSHHCSFRKHFLNTHTYTLIHTCTHTCMHTHTHACTHKYMKPYTHALTYMYTRALTHMYTAEQMRMEQQ